MTNSPLDIILPVRSVFDMPAEMYEESLARVYDDTQNLSLIILSAYKGGRDPDPAKNKLANDIAHNELIKLVGSHGLGYLTAKGRFIENRGQPDERPVDEKLLLVRAAPEHHDRLIAMAKHFGRHFDQDSVLFKHHADENAYLLGTTKRGFVDPPFGKTKLLGKYHPNKVGDYMAMLRLHRRGGHAFVFGESIAPEDSIKVVFLRQRSFFSRFNTLGYDDRIY